ncbi:MAG: bifunctional 4-hydroxy-2-oxoglutarate aldolase/2-dehydro-3-deoxy-phosphogluconate aldolase [Ignavibacteria bacterium]|nr:bifunctional 4-hydroxy-2-oxoglutarate aldolase/2-dehydro-3-deoxy-phosphogluconate aldolase [Ignavibacteria bacterium]
MLREEILQTIIENGAVAVLRLSDGSKFEKVAEAIYAGGVKSIELTMTTPHALEILAKARKNFEGEMLFGMGSILNEQMAIDAANAGACYIVSPVYKREIIDAAHRFNLPVMPGAFSPTEILDAFEYGADVVKVFPADVLGMDFFKGIKAPMPHLKLMPTGGVNLTNAGEWLKAGACAVGIGTALLNKKAIDENRFEALTENAKVLMRSIEKAREEMLIGIA